MFGDPPYHFIPCFVLFGGLRSILTLRMNFSMDSNLICIGHKIYQFYSYFIIFFHKFFRHFWVIFTEPSVLIIIEPNVLSINTITVKLVVRVYPQRSSASVADWVPLQYIVMLGNWRGGGIDFQVSQCIPMGPNLPLMLIISPLCPQPPWATPQSLQTAGSVCKSNTFIVAVSCIFFHLTL